jgi:hypothetical protein
MRVCHAAAMLALALSTGGVLADDIGRIKFLHGYVAIDRGGETIPAQLGLPVRVKDRLLTGPDGQVGVTLHDETRLSLGRNSELKFDGFSFDASSHEGSMTLSILRGVMRFVSGLLVKNRPGALEIVTQQATIGVRGTDFIVEVPDA